MGHAEGKESKAMNYTVYVGSVVLAAVVSAKWAMELGHSQARQFIWGLGGLLFGPLIPLILYIRLLRKGATG